MTYLWHYVISRLAGLFRHHLATSSNGNGVGSTSIDEGRQSPLPKTSTPQLQQPATSTTSDSSAALDYRCFPNQPKIEPQSEVIIFSLSHYYPLASGWSFKHSFLCRLASWLELGNHVGVTFHLYWLLPIQLGYDLSTMRVEPGCEITNSGLMHLNVKEHT